MSRQFGGFTYFRGWVGESTGGGEEKGEGGTHGNGNYKKCDDVDR